MLRGCPSPLVAEQVDALGSRPGSSKEYEFDSHRGDAGCLGTLLSSVGEVDRTASGLRNAC